MEGWREVRLGDVCEIIMGQSPKGEDCNGKGVGVPLLNGPTEFGSSYPTPTQWTTNSKKECIMNDLLFCVRSSTTGRMNWANLVYCIGRGLAAIRHKNGVEYKHFVKGLIDVYLEEILNSATGSTFPNVSKDLLNNISVTVPPLETQKRIAKILSSFDDKIELNNKINDNLEQQAQAIFKSWFVDFEPFGGVMPNDWEVYSFDKILKVRTEKSDNANIPMFSVTDNGIFPRDEKFNKKLSKSSTKNKVIYKHDLVFGMSREILNWGLMKEATGGVSSAYNVFSISNLVFPLYLEGYMKNNPTYFKDIIKPASREGQGIDKSALLQKEIYTPQNTILDKYYEIENAITDTIKLYNSENNALSQLRDTLLPRLMSGELDVS